MPTDVLLGSISQGTPRNDGTTVKPGSGRILQQTHPPPAAWQLASTGQDVQPKTADIFIGQTPGGRGAREAVHGAQPTPGGGLSGGDVAAAAATRVPVAGRARATTDAVPGADVVVGIDRRRGQVPGAGAGATRDVHRDHRHQDEVQARQLRAGRGGGDPGPWIHGARPLAPHPRLLGPDPLRDPVLARADRAGERVVRRPAAQAVRGQRDAHGAARGVSIAGD